MKTLLCLALSGAAAVASAQKTEADAAAQTALVRAVASLPVLAGATENFTGTVRITSQFQAQSPARSSGAVVSFDARARTAWHSHPLGQTLIVMTGLGIVQQQGHEPQVIQPGDVVNIPANVLHWHGAGPESAMSHVAIAEKESGSSVSWKDKVSEAQYQAALLSAGLGSAQQPLGMPDYAARSVEQPQAAVGAASASDILSAKQRSIPLIASFVATSDKTKLNIALNEGLDAGMTISEAREILVQLYAYAGFPKSLNALSELLSVVSEREQRGIKDAVGRSPTRASPIGDELIAAGRANQTRISGGLVEGPVFDFAPIINQFLQAHLFGDIFERDNLDWQSRELATVGALAATPGVEAQLRSHMLASMRVGLSVAQLRQLTHVLAESGNADAATRARDALTRALATASNG